MAKKLTTEQIWQEWKTFRKNLNEAIRINDYMEVNSEYDLEDVFAKEDADKMLKTLDKLKETITNIKVSLK
jgi:hypothetical protein